MAYGALGGFAGGLFGGASSVLQMYGMYQGIQQQQAGIDAGKAVEAARNADTAQGSENASNVNVQGYQGGQPDAAGNPTGSVTPQDMSSTRTDYVGPPTPDDYKPGAIANPSATTPKDDTDKSKPKEVDIGKLKMKQAEDGLKLAKKTFLSPGSITSTAPGGGAGGSSAQSNATGGSNAIATPNVPSVSNPAKSPTKVPDYEGSPLPQTPGPRIWTADKGIHRSAVGESGITWDPNTGLKRTEPYAGTPPAPSPVGNASPLQPPPTLAGQQPVADAHLSQDARAAPYQNQPPPPTPATQVPERPQTSIAAPASSPFRDRRGGDLQQRQAPPPGGPAFPQANSPGWQPLPGGEPGSAAAGAPPGPNFPQANSPGWQPMSGGEPGSAAAAQPAPPPQVQPSWAGQVLSAINPIGSAQAAPPPSPPGSGNLPADGAPPGYLGQGPPGSGRLPPAARDEPAQAGPPIATGEKTTTPAAPAPASDAKPTQTQTGPTETAAKVAPGQVERSEQSEATPQFAKPTIHTGPYELLQQQRPDLAAKVDAAAKKYGVLPQEVAAHWYTENKLQEKWQTGTAGETGIMQIEPKTRTGLDPQNTRDDKTTDGSLDLGAQRIRMANNVFGQGTPSAYLAYMRGETFADSAAKDLDAARKDQPLAFKAVEAVFGPLTQSMFTHGKLVDARAIVTAEHTGGPDGVLRALVNSGPVNMGMTDLWRSAETALMKVAAMRGDYAGLQHAQDWVFQMTHQGAISNLMAADKALLSGQPETAAQYLAKAHAFVPDNSYARFGVGADGKVYGEQFSELTGQPIGGRREITHDAMAYQLMSTQDPIQFTKLVQEQQKNNALIALNQSRAGYYDDLPEQRREAAKLRAQTAREGQENQAQIQQQHDETRRDVAATNAAARQGHMEADNRNIDKGASDAYGPNGSGQQSDTMFTDPQTGAAHTPERKQAIGEQASAIYGDVRRTSRDAGSPVGDLPAQSITRKLMDGTAKVDRRGGVNAVVDEKGNPLGFISDGLANRLGLAGAKPQQQTMGQPRPSPVGAGAGSQMAAMAGMGMNLTGQPIQPMQQA